MDMYNLKSDSMDVLVYAPPGRQVTKLLVRLLEQSDPAINFNIYRNSSGFRAALQNHGFHSCAVIVLAGSGSDLNDVMHFKHALDDRRLLLVLPDRSDATIANAHSLYPRYLSYADKCGSDICDVLKKMRCTRATTSS